MASEIAKAYVQIIPTAKGIKGSIAEELGGESEKAGKDSGSKFSSGFKSVIGGVGKAAAGAVGAASTAVAGVVKSAVSNFSEYEQLAGGVEKIFADMDTSTIINDAAEAYKDLGLSANQYLATINDVGATFASTMGATEGYDTARKGLMAISDYASGTGKDVDQLSEKFMMITRASSSYQSIADQFSGILPATSASFLEQAQSAGFLAEEYTKLTDVPIEEYQQAVTQMLSKGVEALNLTGNTAAEATGTLSGSLTMFQGAWQNLLTSLGTGDTDAISESIQRLVESATAVGNNIKPVIEGALQGVSQLISELAPQLASMFPDIIAQILPGLLSAGVSIVQNLGSGIIQALPTITPIALDVIQQLLSTLLTLAPELLQCGISIISELATGIAQALPELIPLATDILVELVNSIISNIPLLVSAANDIVVGLMDGIMTALPILIGALPDIITGVIDALLQSLPIIIQGFTQIFTGLVQHLPEIVQALIEAAPQILFGLIGAIVENVPALVEAFITLFVAVAEALPEIVMVLVESIPQSFVEIGNAFMGLLPILQETFSGIMTQLAPTFAELGTAAQTAWEAIKSAFENVGTWMKTKFTTAVNNVKTVVNTLKTYFKTVWESIKNVFSDVGTKFLSVGQGIVSGIQKGLSSSWANLKAFLSKACGDLIALAKRILGIGSPSKEFADQVGQWIPAGIAQGIKNNLGVLDSAIHDMTGDVLQTSVSGTVETINSMSYEPMSPVGSQGETVVINNTITVDGAQDPEAWTRTFISTLKREARMA